MCKNKVFFNTKGKKAISIPAAIRCGCLDVTALHPQNVGLSYHGSRPSPTAPPTFRFASASADT